MEVLILWWLTIQIMGLCVLPLSRYLFRWLPDGGYAFSKPLGLLLCSYILWLGASLGVLHNTRTTTILIVVAVGLLSWLGLSSRIGSFRVWWRNHKRTVLVVELFFAAVLVGFALLRAYDPAIAMTEKPMEFAFLNSILRCDTFPPNDPWMSGYAISYYYFGYVIVGFLTKLSGLASEYTFNLSIALVAALAATGVSSLVYNLVVLSARHRPSFNRGTAERYGVFAGVIAVVMGNLESWVELFNNNSLLPAQIRNWLAIRDLPPAGGSPGLLPTDWMWWWRASRVVGSVDPISGATRDYTINEFPFFSYLLGDLHPHVLALPFGLLCLALALNLLVSGEPYDIRFWLRQRRLELLVLVLVFGGLAFLNTWDLPAYLLVLIVAYGISLYWKRRGIDKRSLMQIIMFGGTVLVLGVVFYFPFFLTLGSQAQGIGIVSVRTSPQQFWLHWASFAFLVIVFLLSQVLRWWERRGISSGPSKGSSITRWMWVSGALIVLVLVAMVDINAATLAMLGLCLLVAISIVWQWIAVPKSESAAPSMAAATLMAGAYVDEFSPLETSMINESVADAEIERSRQATMTTAVDRLAIANDNEHDLGRIFALVLVIVAFALLAGGEVLYLADSFGNRMNTIFKIYYQAWALLAVAVGFLFYYLRQKDIDWPTGTVSAQEISSAKTLSAGFRRVAVVGFVLLAVMGLYFPVASVITNSAGSEGGPRLDGQAYLEESNPNDYAAILWLRDTVSGSPVILEAPGESYSEASRISENTGLPTVLGWAGHEMQWRGSGAEGSRRKADIDTIYTTLDSKVAQQLMNKYGVTYVYIGGIERQTYAANGTASLQKFANFMDVAYRNTGVTIYKTRN